MTQKREGSGTVETNLTILVVCAFLTAISSQSAQMIGGRP
eukprot:COSAG02_NODE_37105_length_446_cov_1.017291_1_plen_39_part_10